MRTRRSSREMRRETAGVGPSVLGVVGSPRIGGNTDLLVDEVLAGARAEGGLTVKVHLGEVEISSCRGCEACATTKECVIQDDMFPILAQMDTADIWVLGTPIYFWGPSGWFKCFVDRWHGGKYMVDFKKKRAALVIPFESTERATSRFTTGMLQETLEYLGVTVTEIVLAAGVLAPGDVKNRPDVMSRAYRAGRKAVRTWAPL